MAFVMFNRRYTKCIFCLSEVCLLFFSCHQIVIPFPCAKFKNSDDRAWTWVLKNTEIINIECQIHMLREVQTFKHFQDAANSIQFQLFGLHLFTAVFFLSERGCIEDRIWICLRWTASYLMTNCQVICQLIVKNIDVLLIKISLINLSLHSYQNSCPSSPSSTSIHLYG